MNLTYEIINDGKGYMIKNDGVNWIMQDSYIPYPGATVEESAQNHIDQILLDFNRPKEPTEIELLKAENEALKASQLEQDTLIMELILGGAV